MKKYLSKTVYRTKGPAAEYSKWGCNIYNGCSSRCTYCFNRNGERAETLGGDYPILKKKLIDEDNAMCFLKDDIEYYLEELQQHGFLLNFVSDPFLPETTELNLRAIFLAQSRFVPVKTLTKQADWVDDFLQLNNIDKDLIACGFTLTGHDELEPGAASNFQRIQAMKRLKDAGYKTFVSIEPVITFPKSLEMIKKIYRLLLFIYDRIRPISNLYKRRSNKICLRCSGFSKTASAHKNILQRQYQQNISD